MVSQKQKKYILILTLFVLAVSALLFSGIYILASTSKKDDDVVDKLGTELKPSTATDDISTTPITVIPDPKPEHIPGSTNSNTSTPNLLEDPIDLPPLPEEPVPANGEKNTEPSLEPEPKSILKNKKIWDEDHLKMFQLLKQKDEEDMSLLEEQVCEDGEDEDEDKLSFIGKLTRRCSAINKTIRNYYTATDIPPIKPSSSSKTLKFDGAVKSHDGRLDGMKSMSRRKASPEEERGGRRF